MKHLLSILAGILMFSSLSIAQTMPEKTNEELIEIARQTCQVSDERFARYNVTITKFEDQKMWSVSFWAKPDENGAAATGNHFSANIYFDGSTKCRGGA